MYYLSGMDEFVGLGATRPVHPHAHRRSAANAANKAAVLDIAQTNVQQTGAALRLIDAELARNPHDQNKRALRAQYKNYLNQQKAVVSAAKAPSFFSGLGFFSAVRAPAVPRLNRPAYPFKGYACKAGGGVRQNQLKAEAYCAATQALQAVVSSCAPFSWYCDPTRPVRKRAGNPKAPPGQTAPPGGAYPTGFAPCPDGYSMPNPATGQCPGVVQPSPFYPTPNYTGAIRPTQDQYGRYVLCPAGYSYTPPQPSAAYGAVPAVLQIGSCVPTGMSQPAGACPPGAMFDPNTSSCVSAIGGQPLIGPSYYQPSPFPGYQPPPSYMPPSPYGYSGPMLTPIDSGGDMSEGGTPIYSGGAPAAMMAPMSMGPLLTPIDEGMQFTDQVPSQQAAGGMPSPMGPTQANSPCQQEVVSQPGSDKYGPLQIVQIVCAPSSPTAAVASGSPMPGVFSPDEIAQQEISTFSGMGRYIG